MTSVNTQTKSHAAEVAAGERFEFGENWRSFLSVLNEERIANATESLVAMLGWNNFQGKRFLDIGSGSGLSSLVAFRLGAQVVSFDYDPASVACTRELRSRYAQDSDRWRIEQGSAISPEFMGSLGTFDVVYSWGVLHHTGDMWKGLDLASSKLDDHGRIFVALYNDQGSWSRRWAAIKRTYCSGAFGKAVVSATVIPYWVLRGAAADIVWRRNPWARYRDYSKDRGMSVTHDWFDWLGGYPFEVAKPEAVLRFFRERGLQLINLRTAGGSVGCNEFVFELLRADETTQTSGARG